MTSLYWDGAKRYHEAIKRGGGESQYWVVVALSVTAGKTCWGTLHGTGRSKRQVNS